VPIKTTPTRSPWPQITLPVIEIDGSSVAIVGLLVGAIALAGGGNPAALVSSRPATAAQQSTIAAPNPSPLGQRIIAAMKAKGYAIDPVFNIVGVSGMNPDGSANDNRPDQWNDLVAIVRPDGTILHLSAATAEPGWRIVQNPIVQPGAAQLAFGQYRGSYQIGTHMGSSWHEALVQTGGPVTIWRDVNKNGRRDSGDRVVSGMFGINWHRAGRSPVKSVGGYSAGCVVTNDINQFAHFLQVVKSHPGYQQNRLFRFTTTLLNGAEL